MTTSWCDKLAATPTIGVRLNPHFLSGDTIMQALALGPNIDSMIKRDSATFQIEEHHSFSAQFITNDGYRYQADHSRLSVGFQYRMRPKPISGGPPIMEMLSQVRPYTEQLETVAERLIDATLLLCKMQERTVNRVGVITLLSVDRNEVPPGVARLIEYMGRPWKRPLEAYNMNITAALDENAEHSDRCIHHLIKFDDPEKLMTLQFDWQRSLAKPRTVSQAAIKEITDKARKDALHYFEELAVGSQFDEEIIGSTI